MVVAVSGAAVVHRRGLLLPKPAARILLAGGLAIAGWLCVGAILSTPASATEQTPSGPETVAVPSVPSEEPAADEPSSEEPAAEEPAEEPSTEPEAPAEEPTGPAETPEPAETPSSDSGTSDSGSVEAEKPVTPEPAPASGEEPEAAVETATLSSANSVETKKSSTSKPSTKTAVTNPGAGLLGGLIGSVLDVVTTTVGGVVHTVGGVVDTVNDKVLAPIVTPGPCEPGSPVILPILDDVLDPIFDGSGGSAGATVTVTVPVRNIVSDDIAPPAMPEPRPLVPAAAPAPAATPHHRVTFPAVQLDVVQSSPAAPVESDTHAAPDGGGGSGGGGGLPSAPVAPAAPTTSAHSGHDTSGGGRGPLAVLDSGMPATQLKLIGAGCDHEGERTGREAALPATSPD